MTTTTRNTMLTLATISQIVGAMTAAQKANAQSVIVALDKYGARFGLDQPHRLAQYLAQLLHESGAFKWDREIWGPTPAQKSYEGRADLGNIKAGDGKRFAGHGPLQITGRANHREFTAWCRKNVDKNAPDFEARPDLVNTDPWEGVGPLWYWQTRGLNKYADRGDVEMISRRVNGGTNGLADRFDWYDKAALVLLGFSRSDVKGFQKKAGDIVDGIAGPRTRSALHQALVKLTAKPLLAASVAAAPVVVETETPVIPKAVDAEVKHKYGVGGWVMGAVGSLGSGVAGLVGMDWQTVVAIGVMAGVAILLGFFLRNQIIAGVKDIRAGLEG